MYNIGELVKRDQQAEFRNDVQLSSYEEPERNLSLVRSYLFTSSAPQGYWSSTSVLSALIGTYLDQRLENRFVAIANYGHGKSHLALALANYFGKPYHSSEVQTILEKINATFTSNSSNALRYTEFKENHGEFLVVRVRGDVPGSLKEQFLNSLEIALREHETLENPRLPGWYGKAEKYLTALRDTDLQRANQYLEQFEIDVPLLLQEVGEKRSRAYDLFVKLFAHLDEHGFQPNMGGELSLDQAIRWAANEFCGENKPLGGILILFDEFNLYITNYAQRSAAGDLQDMLNGVSNCQGKVAFLAFAQQDPVTIAENVLSQASTTQRESLLKELSRIPKQFVLYSLMESVIDSYLVQPNQIWQRFAQESGVSLPLSQATNIALDQFADRYITIGWNRVELFEEKVTKGCFPLHPITTALLCSVQFQQSMTGSGTPRNILGFILEQLDVLSDKPALIGNRINWVLPIYLVDYFGDRLPADRYQAYQQAVQQLDTEDDEGEFSPEEQIDILKALLLQEIAKLKARTEDQIDLIASMVALPPSDTKKCLRMLSDTKVIAWNIDGRKSYSLWASTFNPYKLDQILEHKLSTISLSWNDLISFSKEKLKASPVSIPWGHPQDWQAIEYAIDADNFTSQNLKNLISRFHFQPKGGICEGDRCYLLWLVARNEDEINSYRQTAQQILNEAFSEANPVPVVIVLPARPNYELIEALQKNKALGTFTNTDIEDSGQDVYRAKVAQEALNISNAIDALRGGNNYREIRRWPTYYIVPNPYLARIQQLGQVNLSDLLNELYQIAYRFSPPEFFPQYSVASRNFRNIVKSISIDLLHNDSHGLNSTARASSMAKDLVTLLKEEWQILTIDNRVKEPEHANIRQAWDLIDQTFPASGQEEPAKQVLVELINPPYGYDYNTLVILFCAWFGFNAHDLQISSRGSVISSKELDAWLQAGPKDYINKIDIESVTLARRDATKAAKEVQNILGNLNSGNFSIEQAQEAVAILSDFIGNDRNDPNLIEDAQRGINELNVGIGRANEYDAQVQKILAVIGNQKSVKKLFGHLQSITELTPSTLVIIEKISINDLRKSLMDWIEKVVEEECASLENLKDIADLTYNHSQLEELKTEVTKANSHALKKRIDDAIKNLSESGDKLRDKAQEGILQSSIKGMKPSATLKDLYGYRDELNNIRNVTSDTLRVRDQQLTIINEEIVRLENFVIDAENLLDQLDGQDEFTDFGEKLRQYGWRYKGTPHEKTIQNIRNRVDELGSFFGELINLSYRQPVTVADVQEIRNQLNALGRKYLKIIGEKQRELIEKAQKTLDEKVTKEELTAMEWLKELEAQLAAEKDLPKLRNRLNSPPDFLPGTEKKRVETLIKSVDKLLDKNVVQQIESQFMRIKDADVRKNCLERLQKLFEENK